MPRTAITTIVAAAALLACAGSAQAATLTFDVRDQAPESCGQCIRLNVQRFTLRAEAGEENRIELSSGTDPDVVIIRLRHPRGMDLDIRTELCLPMVDFDLSYRHVACTFPSNGWFREMEVHLGDGDDTLDASRHNLSGVQLIARGGAGNDQITGGPTNDTLVGDGGDDVLFGGSGNDEFRASAGRDGSDTMVGGFDHDVVTYGMRSGRVRLSQDGIANDGARLERDQIHADIEQLVGGSDPDIITGSARRDHLVGLSGNDLLVGGAGDDFLEGGRGVDTLRGESGADALLTFEHSCSFRLRHETQTNRVDGGDGTDHAYVNPADRVVRSETVNRRGSPYACTSAPT